MSVKCSPSVVAQNCQHLLKCTESTLFEDGASEAYCKMLIFLNLHAISWFTKVFSDITFEQQAHLFIRGSGKMMHCWIAMHHGNCRLAGGKPS